MIGIQKALAHTPAQPDVVSEVVGSSPVLSALIVVPNLLLMIIIITLISKVALHFAEHEN